MSESNITICDKCKKEFLPETKEELIKDNISKVFFVCPHCKTEYIPFYTSVLVKSKQKKINKVVAEYRKASGVEPIKAVKLFDQYKKLRKEIGIDMDNLEKKVKSWEE